MFWKNGWVNLASRPCLVLKFGPNLRSQLMPPFFSAVHLSPHHRLIILQSQNPNIMLSLCNLHSSLFKNSAQMAFNQSRHLMLFQRLMQISLTPLVNLRMHPTCSTKCLTENSNILNIPFCGMPSTLFNTSPNTRLRQMQQWRMPWP